MNYKFYLIEDNRLFCVVNNQTFELINNKWSNSSNNEIMDRILGYDSSEPFDSPYAIGNMETMCALKELTREQVIEEYGVTVIEKLKDCFTRGLIDKLSAEMKEILEKELEAGNEIVETYQGGFTNVSAEHIFIFLKYPFKTKIQNNLNGIIYKEINDRHYWKAEYTDEKNHQTLACNF